MPGVSVQTQVFSMKLQADFRRYLAEVAADTGAQDTAARESRRLYEQAMSLAETRLEATDPLRLGVALNYAVCLHEIMKDTQGACQLAKTVDISRFLLFSIVLCIFPLCECFFARKAFFHVSAGQHFRLSIFRSPSWTKWSRMII